MDSNQLSDLALREKKRLARREAARKRAHCKCCKPALKHRFGDNLMCDNCGVSILKHAKNPVECPKKKAPYPVRGPDKIKRKTKEQS